MKKEVIDTLLIAKRDKTIAKLTPMKKEKSKSLFGSMKGTFTIKGDIISPINKKWKVNSNE